MQYNKRSIVFDPILVNQKLTDSDELHEFTKMISIPLIILFISPSLYSTYTITDLIFQTPEKILW